MTSIKVLHVFGSLNKGGIETWLMNILRLELDKTQFDFYLVELNGVYESEAIDFGCVMHQAPPIRQLNAYLKMLKSIISENNYDVVHVHGEEFMGDIMRVAANLDVPVRIAHCHGTQLARGKKGFVMWLRGHRHRLIDRLLIKKYSTHILGCSSDAGRFLLGKSWSSDSRCKTLYCGVPLDIFGETGALSEKSRLCNKYGVPSNAVVVGHAGSMGPSPVKNHLFIIDVFFELCKNDPNCFLFLAGDGPQRSDIEAKVNRLSLNGRVIMPGICDDVPSLMVNLFDVHLLPSLWEGLPIAGLEAVASGLFTVCSDSITRDYIDAFPQRIKALSLNEDPETWAGAVAVGIKKREPTEVGATLIKGSDFSIKSSWNTLHDLYLEGVN